MQKDVNEILNKVSSIKKDIGRSTSEIERLLISLGSDIIHQKEVEHIEETKKRIDELKFCIKCDKEEIEILKQNALDIIEKECDLDEQ